MTTPIFEIILLVAVGLLVLAAGWIAYELRFLGKLLAPTKEEKIKRIKAQSEANIHLLRDNMAKETLAQFVLSEAALRKTLESLESHVASSETEISPEILAKTVSGEPWYKAAWKWIKENKGKITEKLFDKLNDLVKGVLPGATKEK